MAQSPMSNELKLIVEQAQKIAVLEMRAEELQKQNEEFRKMHDLLEQALACAGRARAPGFVATRPGTQPASGSSSAGSIAPGVVAVANQMAARCRVSTAASPPTDADSSLGYPSVARMITPEEVTAKSEELLKAAKDGRLEDVRRLLRQGADPSYVGSANWSALHYAASFNNSEMVSALISAGATVDVADENGSCPLHWAAQIGSKEAVCVLLQAGAAVNAKGADYCSPLYFAVSCCQTECAKALLAAGADLNFVKEDGDTLLHTAASKGAVACVKVLLDAGADPMVPNKDGITAKDLINNFQIFEMFKFV